MKLQTVLLLMLVILTACSGGEEKLIIFHAGSLSVPMQQLKAAFLEEHPGLEIQSEAAGSRSCARKISDLGRDCDVFASADYTVIDQLLIPDFASWNISFASNEMALAYTSDSRYFDEIGSGNWYEILGKDDVAYGRSEPDSDPCGYRTVLCLHLAERYYALPMAKGLLAKDVNLIRPKETDLLGMLESGVLDYVFIYKSVALQHGLQILELPEEINLGSPELADIYALAGVEISGKTPGSTIKKRGEPMVYGLTIPRGAPNRGKALEFVHFMLSEKGQAIMEDCGQSSLIASPSSTFKHIPESLREFALDAEQGE